MPHVLAQDLRVAVLRAAFEGKLTVRNSDDTLVRDTLNNIIEQKKSNKIKTQKVENAIEPLFDVPEEWAWVYLPEIAVSGLGKTLNAKKDQGKVKPYLCSINVYWSGVDLTTVKEARFSDTDIEKYRLCRGDLLVCEGGDVGRTIIWESDNEMYYQNALHRVRFLGGVSQYYFRYLLLLYKMLGVLDDASKGMTIKHLVQGALNSLPIPLPPIEEQARIVARVDELMAKIDEYEKLEKGLVDLQSKFPGDMKSAILQSAFEGKLTVRDLGDTLVRDTLNNIIEYKKSNKIKTPKIENVIKPLFDIPEEWEWVYLPEIAVSGLGKTLNAKKDQGEVKPYLCSINVYWSGIDLTTVKEARFGNADIEKYRLYRGDVLICEGGDVGRTIIWESDSEMYYQNALHRVRFFGGVSQYYFRYLLLFYKMIGVLDNVSKGMTIKHLVQGALNSLPIPFPPIEEQQRIVEKLDQLLPLVERLDKMND